MMPRMRRNNSAGVQEDRSTSGFLTLLRVSSLSHSDVFMEERKREERRKIRRTNTFSHC
jgi:hypothetical protein